MFYTIILHYNQLVTISRCDSQVLILQHTVLNVKTKNILNDTQYLPKHKT